MRGTKKKGLAADVLPLHFAESVEVDCAKMMRKHGRRVVVHVSGTADDVHANSGVVPDVEGFDERSVRTECQTDDPRTTRFRSAIE